MADNVRLIKECFDAFARGEPGYIVERVTSDVDWKHIGGAGIPYAGNYRGRQGVADFFGKIGASLDVLEWIPEHIVPAGSEVIAIGAWKAKAKPTGRTFSAEWAMVFGVRNGEIASFKVVEDTATVEAAFRR